MKEETYNKEKIEAYLLGSLPETEAERFDELSFTSDEFADQLKATEADLIDAYVHNELNGAPLEKFKSFYLASPLRREKVEFAKNFQVFAEREIAAKKNFAAEESKSKRFFAGFFAALNTFKNQSFALQSGFAAAALLLMILGGLWVFNSRFNQTETQIAKENSSANTEQKPARSEEQTSPNSSVQTEDSTVENKNSLANIENNSSPKQTGNEKSNKRTTVEPARTPLPKEIKISPKPVVASFLLLPSLRGNNRIQSVSIAKDVTDAAMQLQLEADDYPAYRVQLIDQSSGKSLRRVEAVKAKTKGANKQLNVSFPAGLLKSQIYTLQISGVSADGKSEIISDYPFRVVR